MSPLFPVSYARKRDLTRGKDWVLQNFRNMTRNHWRKYSFNPSYYIDIIVFRYVRPWSLFFGLICSNKFYLTLFAKRPLKECPMTSSLRNVWLSQAEKGLPYHWVMIDSLDFEKRKPLQGKKRRNICFSSQRSWKEIVRGISTDVSPKPLFVLTGGGLFRVFASGQSFLCFTPLHFAKCF